MSWTSLFKSKDAAPEGPDPTLHWFGKLPTYSDYHGAPSGQAWAVEFNDWVLRGFENYHSRAAADRPGPDRLPDSLCVIRLPKSGMTAFASIRDYGGDARGRPFPMCFYIGLPTEDWPGPTSDRIAAAWPVLRELAALGEEAATLSEETGRLATVLGERRIDVSGITRPGDDSWTGPADSLQMADWFAAVPPGLDGQDLDGWLRLVDEWGGNIAGLESEDFEATLCFPLASALSANVQVAGWTRWLEARMDLERRAVSLIVTRDVGDGTGRFVVIARNHVDAADFLLTTSLAGSLSYVDDLSALRADGAGPGNDPSEPVHAAGSGVTWAQFVGCRPVDA